MAAKQRRPTWQAFSVRVLNASFGHGRPCRIILAPEATDRVARPEYLAHLSNMTDDTGMLQHAIFSVPNCSEGYTTDDNARALIVTTLLSDLRRMAAMSFATLSRRYLAFLWLAFHDKTAGSEIFWATTADGRKKCGSEDSHGRALWALGNGARPFGRCGTARSEQADSSRPPSPATLTFTSPRAWAFSVLGMQAYLDWFPGDRVIQGSRNVLANRLLDTLRKDPFRTWQWFEKSLSYSNAQIVTGADSGRMEKQKPGE